ncbi:MAG: hypothetical protein CO135_03845 [Candidatus Levybacteria bacterium CG_4_9_14_3_um_filter_35_16]|nr:MAG: hypothetical protein COW87_02005 [Candidatus Levybacteria bacterium CG22_combo_CG10-13_8_21_14_all_35_11]PIY94839.1 MAG: hypothetical protein COY68_01105 [Candidatus Levybacteria bacterium CG_4_10_14_0_8_um_filter_35_23]PJA90907.1 MAG: hypothetical protein CO135_03845 [Candidatus Levybacteria bacterium CG_4_9_14_3_um_filter_35_16]PJC54579.1 MAG: hypothetical protein CO028_01670 [Candidatus Levybacteria bacterium CG_4_9_14_0_2_um_filter_35_21]
MNKNKKIFHFQHLKKKWSDKHKEIEKQIVKKHGHLIASLIPKQQIIGGVLLAAVPFMQMAPQTVQAQINNLSRQETPKITPQNLVLKISELLPKEVRPLIPGEEKVITDYLSEVFKIKVFPELEGIRLNRSYGLIGQEQHLKRYFGDSTDQHFDNEKERESYSLQGIAPGLGAWGYFAKSKDEMTENEKLREKYYIAVPTFLAPGFNENVGRYGLFFKYRKMLVVNPENGKAIVTDIADAGPAEWTDKHLGGSPEVMGYLERVDGAQKGPVLYFFIDDSNDTIPLGPISL